MLLSGSTWDVALVVRQVVLNTLRGSASDSDWYVRGSGIVVVNHDRGRRGLQADAAAVHRTMHTCVKSAGEEL